MLPPAQIGGEGFPEGIRNRDDSTVRRDDRLHHLRRAWPDNQSER